MVKKLKTKIPKVKEHAEEALRTLPNHISDYFTKVEGSKEAFHARELFKADKSDVDIKTELTDKEIAYINVLIFNDAILEEAKMPPVYREFIYHYMRLKISKNRASRTEFVAINKTDNTEGASQLLANMANINGVKK